VWLAGTCSGCIKYVVVPEPALTGPVLIAPSSGRKSLQPSPASYKFRVAVLDFIDQTNSAGDLVRTIPDILTTNLFETQRYDIFDRGQLRDKSSNQAEKEIADLKKNYLIDGVIVGSITRFSPQSKELTIDIRVINAQSTAVMFAVQHTVHYTGVLDVRVDRDDITALSTKVAQSIPKVPDARVAAINGSELIISVGEEQGVKKGMAIFVVATGDTLEDPATGDALSSRYIIAEAYVNAVEPRITHALVFRPVTGSWVRPGDLVHFK
jgi:hypothetical protein